ncbi:hypothetical protein L3V82_10800 [Thiotrichales bacterium 19S3-7]|nr:hypothetical protein [Thiotrichales bacterium 19S3-7]MCF6802646.1 hypothetical protein [Thiotrichales bacterium 19S3-11]
MDLPTPQEALLELVFAVTNKKGPEAEKKALAKLKGAIERNNAKAYIQQLYVMFNSLLSELKTDLNKISSTTPGLFGDTNATSNKKKESTIPHMPAIHSRFFC